MTVEALMRPLLSDVAVLGAPPIDSPQKAVQAAVMAHIEKQQRRPG